MSHQDKNDRTKALSPSDSKATPGLEVGDEQLEGIVGGVSSGTPRFAGDDPVVNPNSLDLDQRARHNPYSSADR